MNPNRTLQKIPVPGPRNNTLISDEDRQGITKGKEETGEKSETRTNEDFRKGQIKTQTNVHFD